jgi:hypothetical protein
LSITYPITLPTTGSVVVKVTAQDAVAVVQSSFTFQSQVQQWPGQLLSYEVQLPPMQHSTAEQWTAALVSLMGQYGTCLFVDPSYKGPYGITAGSTPVVNGTNNAQSQVLNVRGLAHSITGWLKAGDCVSVSNGTTVRLYKTITDSTSDSSGNSTLNIYPSIREALSDGAAITLINPAGTFRLASNTRSWSIDNALIYGISFALVEAI